MEAGVSKEDMYYISIIGIKKSLYLAKYAHISLNHLLRFDRLVVGFSPCPPIGNVSTSCLGVLSGF